MDGTGNGTGGGAGSRPASRAGRGASLTHYAWLSVATAVATIALKAVAWLLTDSVGLLSDALEGGVNLVAALVALVALRVAARPPDDDHHFGHGKAEYFSAGVEGLMIFVAAVVIVATAAQRLVDPRPIEQVGLGLAVSTVAAVLNGAVGWRLLRAGRAHRSPTLVADGKHLLTDVWTSAGVLVGVGLVGLTGWAVLDPVVALLVGLNILVVGFGLVRRSAGGLMDTALPGEDRGAIDEVLGRYRRDGVTFHAIRTRASGRDRFLSVHVLVPGAWTVATGHDLLERLERDLRRCLPGLHVHTHLEPVEDPVSWGEEDDDRAGTPY